MLTLHLLMILKRSHNSRETREWVDVHLFLLHTDKASRQRVLVIADVLLAAKVPSILLRIILVIYCWQGL